MKRRLPITIESGSVLAAINIPPVTALANRHNPKGAHPGSPTAAPHDALNADTAQRPRSKTGTVTRPPNSTATAAKATAILSARCLNRHHQSRAVV